MSFDYRVHLSDARRDAMKVYGVRPTGSVAQEPISLDQAYFHLRVDTFGSPPVSSDDSWLSGVGIPAARQWCEQYCARSIAQQALELATTGFPAGGIPLPFGPVQSVISVAYLDADGIDRVVDEEGYEINDFTVPAMLLPAFSTSWPMARQSPNSVRVQYIAGFSPDGDSPNPFPLPPAIRAAMLLMLGHLYENREATNVTRATDLQQIPLGAASLLDFNRARLGLA